MEVANRPLKKHEEINSERLNKNQYTLSLLMEGFRCGLIYKETLDSIQSEVMILLKDLILSYTKGESNSVTVEAAERILNSIFYSIDAAVKPYSCLDAIGILKSDKIREAYEAGTEKLKLSVEETKKLYWEVRENKLDIPLEAYNYTIDEGFKGIFEKNDIIFNTLDIKVDIDYPLAHDDMSIRGIFYIKTYLETLKMENEFCHLFNNDEIVRTLKNYGRIYSIDYAVTLINIFEIVLYNSVFSVISGNSAERLTISSAQYDFLNSRFTGLNINETGILIDEAFDNVINDLNIGRQEMIDYICQSKTALVQRIMNAVLNNNLQNLIVTDKNDKSSYSGFSFIDGERMDDKSFRKLAGKIMKSRNTSGKIKIIKDNVHSLQDLIDIFNGDCLFEDEYIELFNTLDDAETAALGRTVFYDELRDGPLRLSALDTFNKKLESEWQIQYIRFIQALSKERTDYVENLINQIY